MKIFVNENGQTVDVKENRFVANAAWFDNVIDIYYAGDNYDLSYVIISFKRADGFVILNKVAAAYPDNEDGFMWRYTIPEYGGVLDIAGQLEVSAQLIKAYYNEGETVAYKREIRASVSATATVRINIGISNQEEYDAVAEEFAEINNDITGRINAIVNDIGTEDMGTTSTTIKGAIAEHEGDIIDHKERIDTAETTIADHEERIDAAETTIADHESRIDTAETTIADHESRIGIAESSITNHENRLSVAEDTIAEHEGDIIDHEERINEAEATIIDHGNDIGGIKADIGTASISGIAVDIKAAINSLNSDIDSLQQGIVHRAIRGLITSPTASTLTPDLEAAMTGYIETQLGRAPNLTDAIAVRDTEDADLSMIFTYYYWTATASDSTEGWYLAAHYKTPAFTETPAFTSSYSEDDWSADADENGLYKFSIDAATHGMGATSNLLIRMLKLIGSDYVQISQFYVSVDGTVTLYTDDKTLTGIVVIATSTSYYVPALTEYGSVSVTNVIGLGALGTKDTVDEDDITAESDLAAAVTNSHTHANKAALDAYTADSIPSYDKIIKTQAEFEEMIGSEDWLGATSVALVGQFTLSTANNSGIKVPATVKQIHGFNSAKITITNFLYNSSTAKGGLWYDIRPETLDYSIRDLEVDCTGTGIGAYSYGFYNCTNLTNCTGTGTWSSGAGFRNCTNLTNCTGTGAGSGDIGVGFYDCDNLTNCTGTGTGPYGYGFRNCTNLTNCTGTGTGPYGYGFRNCTNLTNCTGTGTGTTEGYGFYNITTASNCRDGGFSTAMWSGTNTNIDIDTCCKTPVEADNTTLNT